MLEIIILIVLSIQISKIAKRKGRSPVGWVLMLIGLWIGGEVTGALIGVFGSAIVGGGDEPNLLVVLVGALLGAVTGAIITFSVVNSLSTVRRDDEYWQAPESDAYREKFDGDKYRDTADRDRYRPKDGEDGDKSAADEQAYRGKTDEG
jgi:hypothetical protein